MKNLKTYRMFESVMELTPEQVQWLDKCKRVKGSWTLNLQTGLIDVKGDFDCSKQGLTDFKGVRFGVVDEYFYCDNNALTTLKGAPKTVHSFSCSDNELTTLEGAPQSVGGGFYCHNNSLTSLEGAPQEVGHDFDCHNNNLTSLVGAPQKVGWDFACHYNALTSLVGAPQNVDGHFYCENNRLTSLMGAPQRVGRDFDCRNNQLTSLMGAPQRVGRDFDCRRNALTSLVGAPREVSGYFYCEKNQVSEKTLKKVFDKMQKCTSYLAAVESIWSKIPQDDQVLLYADDFKWVTPEQSRGIVALRAYQGLRGML